MAINIEWQVKPPVKDEEKPQMFPRIVDSEIVNEHKLAKRIASHGSLSRGNAIAALDDFAEVMANLLREGKTINIPMLGSFKLSIGTDADIRPDSNRRMQSVVVKGVNFQPTQELIDAIGKPTFQWKPTTGVAIAPHNRQAHTPTSNIFQYSRQHHPRRVRTHIRSKTHHRLYAFE